MARLGEPSHRRPPAWNRVLVIAAILVVVIFAIWAITTGAVRFLGSDHGDAGDRAGNPAKTGQPTVGTTRPVTDGDLQMQLRSLQSTGPRTLTATVTVQNRTAAFVSFYGESQELVSSENRTVAGQVSLTSLEPHEAATVALVFTVPAGFRATELHLHAAPGTAGVPIKLS
ncbi:hypothetical protein [Cryptosporangium phraense]|uniref:DUF4352 domain-containing protein n=1 Tax=Cryptosporangium phraense TaxID=2593070 RepID=A0A545AKW5_9ACTN|nr:hypothetical protein [Cryptosporangium phraense]TQS41958.1 hypothetical protein FL583_27140 [Cryptosporangium phraense]